MNYHLKFLLSVVLRILSWIIITNITVDKFVIRQIVSIITRNHFRKTWLRLNKIHLVPVYSYLIEIFSWSEIFVTEIFEREIESDHTHNFIRQENLVAFFRRLLHFSVTRALSRHCVLRYFPARVCSVNLRLLTHTTPLFCFFYFKLLFSKTLGLVVIYSSISIDDPFRLSQPTKLYWCAPL